MKILLILERVWLGIALVTLGVAAWLFFTEGFDSAVLMLIGTVAASLMYWVRRKQRIRFEKKAAK